MKLLSLSYRLFYSLTKKFFLDITLCIFSTHNGLENTLYYLRTL